jgi:hypothetical protein
MERSELRELTRRYVVMSMAAEAPFDPGDPEAVFVLKPWKDPAALRALAAYRDNCYPELAGELDVWIRIIETGPSVRGDVGRRNEPHVKRARADGARAPARRAAKKRSSARPHPRATSTKAARRRAASKRRKRSR